MSAIDTFKKCNLHSAAPYIGGECPGMQKAEGERPERRCPGDNVLHPI